MEINNDSYLNSSEFRPLPLSINVTSPTTTTHHHNSRKKRTKFMKINAGELMNSKSRPVNKKPDPSAPKITRPCTECGKKFSSWKALFGHMRCHPERQWRGINPPPNFKRLTEEDHEVATCLLMLANGPAASAASDQSPSVTTLMEYSDSGRDRDMSSDLNCGRFECSSCKKVFGSHQALGGHRASHKNVKGCYAITKNDGEEEGCCSGDTIIVINNNNNNSNGHKCSICLKVFSSGQALGGHMRCHWEKVEEPSTTFCGLIDLNLAAPAVLLEEEEDDYGDAFSCYSSAGSFHQGLDLRLGL